MSTTDLTNFGAELKELYTLPPVRVINDKCYLHDKLIKEGPSNIDSSGRYMYFPVVLERNLGRGSRGDGGVLPAAGTEVIEDAKVYIKRHYYGLEWTEAVELASKNKEGAFEGVIAMKMKNVAIDMAKEVSRQCYNPKSGALCSVTNTGADDAFTASDSVQFLRVGDVVSIVDPTTGVAITNGTSRRITTINRTTKVVDIADGGGNVDPAGTEIVILAGNFGNEVEGLRYICDDDRDLYGIDSTTYENWDGNVLSANGAPAGESTFEQLYDLVGERGRGDIDTYLTTRGIRRRLADEFASMRRYLNEKATDIKAGYSMVEVNGKECVIDDDCPKKHIFAVTQETLRVMQAVKPGFLETEASKGAVIELKDHTVAGQKVAAWQAWYRYHVNIVCQDPARNGMVTDAEDD